MICKHPTLTVGNEHGGSQGRTDHLENSGTARRPGSVGGPMRYPWYLFHRLF
ncbi:unnamed protein product [Staurois parvus]|uniref:Uncharacterized protein n=1 Tax=Staurois parvus TaxID=386267 RepID=A0ABN9DZC7_9NEOB|nr:unnamed protein product [Staurois parvus]